MSLGKITSITEVFGQTLSRDYVAETQKARLGIVQMLGALCGNDTMDGYEIKTDKHTFFVLINNQQSCCEQWGYFSSDDDFDSFLGKELLEVNLTDVALNRQVVEVSGYYGDEGGGIQFIDFVTSRGTLQLAVYNSHNGYYGHSILVAKDDELLLDSML